MSEGFHGWSHRQAEAPLLAPDELLCPRSLESIRQCGVALCIVLGVSVLAASIGSAVVRDRVTGAKRLQHLSGLGYGAYWFANFLYDMVGVGTARVMHVTCSCVHMCVCLGCTCMHRCMWAHMCVCMCARVYVCVVLFRGLATSDMNRAGAFHGQSASGEVLCVTGGPRQAPAQPTGPFRARGWLVVSAATAPRPQPLGRPESIRLPPPACARRLGSGTDAPQTCRVSCPGRGPESHIRQPRGVSGLSPD